MITREMMQKAIDEHAKWRDWTREPVDCAEPPLPEQAPRVCFAGRLTKPPTESEVRATAMAAQVIGVDWGISSGWVGVVRTGNDLNDHAADTLKYTTHRMTIPAGMIAAGDTIRFSVVSDPSEQGTVFSYWIDDGSAEREALAAAMTRRSERRLLRNAERAHDPLTRECARAELLRRAQPKPLVLMDDFDLLPDAEPEGIVPRPPR